MNGHLAILQKGLHTALFLDVLIYFSVRGSTE